MQKNLPIILTGIAALVIGFGGGYFFKNYQLTKLRGNFMQGGPRFNGQTGANQGVRMLGNRPIEGEILSIDEKGVTIKLADGGSKIVIFSDSTTIDKSVTGAKTDIKINSKVLINGTTNSDGSITASRLQLTSK